MKVRIELLVILVISFTCLTTAQTKQIKISPSEAKDNIGKEVTVIGVVDQVNQSRSGTIYLNMGGKFPDAEFTVVIFKSNASKFKNISIVEGKKIEITGKIKEYKGSPEIILSDPHLLKVYLEKKKENDDEN